MARVVTIPTSDKPIGFGQKDPKVEALSSLRPGDIYIQGKTAYRVPEAGYWNVMQTPLTSEEIQKIPELRQMVQSNPGALTNKPYQPTQQEQQQSAYQTQQSLLQQTISDYQAKLDQANQANEARYQSILGDYGSLYGRSMQNLEGMGAQEASDIRTRYANLGTKGVQNLVSSGMNAGNIRNSMMAGLAKMETEDQARLQERLRTQKIGMDTGLTQARLDFMERKNELGPDQGAFLAALQAYGQGNPYGQGGGTGGGVASTTRIRATTQPGRKNIYQGFDMAYGGSYPGPMARR